MAADDRGPLNPTEAAELARLYDLDMADQVADIDLYLAIARTVEGRVLELAAGSGRVCVPLAAAGHDVVGVDSDPFMLERARRAWNAQTLTHTGDAGAGTLDLIEADLTTLDLEQRFALVILANNSLLMLPGREAQQAALEVMAHHLAPAGRAVIDVYLPAPEDLAIYDNRLELAWIRSEANGDRVAKLWAAAYEPAHALARIDTLFDIWPAGGGPLRRVSRRDELYLVGAAELVAAAERAGLRAETIAGDYDLGPLAPDSQRILLVAGLL